jgi:hypothetical protein
MTQEEIKLVKDTIKSIVEEHIDGQINYEWEGSDFTERLMNELPIDKEISFDRIVQKNESKITFDNELYQKFLNHTTDFIFNSLGFETD